MASVSILIPVFNSEKTIAHLCKTLIEELVAEPDLEIVLVNDCSRDLSGKVCKKLQNDYPGIVTYLELTRNFGEHNALMAGLNYVTGDYCLMMDDDLQNSPKDAWKLIKEIRKGYDVVYTFHETKRDSFFRKIGSNFNNKIANLILKKPKDLYLSSFKIINRLIIDEIIKFNAPDPYIDGIILRSTERIGKVKVGHFFRKHGQSGYTVSKLLLLWENMVLNYSIIPLRIIGVFGITLCISSLIYGLHSFFLDNTFGFLSEHEILIMVMTFLLGIMFLSIALTAEYIGKIHFLLYKNPQFIVREMLPRSINESVASSSFSAELLNAYGVEGGKVRTLRR